MGDTFTLRVNVEIEKFPYNGERLGITETFTVPASTFMEVAQKILADSTSWRNLSNHPKLKGGE